MKAFLLAAGLGTRLKPLTDNTPKCLIKVHGKPILAWWIELMERHGINEVLINLHYLSDQVAEFIQNYKTEIKFELFFEEKLIGSAGTLRENKKFVRDEKDFFVFYADNLTNYNLSVFLNFHRNSNALFSMALFRAANPSSCGIALLNENKTIIDFEEKPEHPKSNLANAGLYIASPPVLDLIPDYDLTDIGYDLLPQLINKMNGWETNDYLIDIGTIQNLEKANNEWLQIIRKEQTL